MPWENIAHKPALSKHPARRSTSGRQSAWERTVKTVLCRKGEATILWIMLVLLEEVVELFSIRLESRLRGREGDRRKKW